MSSFPIGSKVILHNLKKGSQYNGKHGVVKSNPNNGGRQNVLLDYWNEETVAIKPENLKLAPDKAVASSFPIGCNVMIQVADGSEYNGKRGTVKSNLNDRGRQEVKLLDGKTVAVKPEHLSTKGCRQSKTVRPSKKKAAAAEEDQEYIPMPKAGEQFHFQFDPNGGLDSFVMKVKKGDAFATKMLLLKSLRATGNWSILSTGILTSVLSYLRRCENESFERVMASLGGDLVSPSTWVALLLKRGAEENCGTLQIAQKLGPLVRCMCNDTKRTFFRSNEHWKDTIVLFVKLITTMLTRAVNDSDKIIIDAVLKHEGLLSSIIQWGFWGNKYRPDLVEELSIDNWPQFHIREVEVPKIDVCTDYVSSCGTKTSQLLITYIGSSFRDDHGLELLLTIGSTPIENHLFNSTFVVELIYIVKNHKGGNDLRCLQCLVNTAGCVDKSVITDIVDWGANCTTDYYEALEVAEISHGMICQIKSYPRAPIPCDTRTAFAIRAGLIDMCLGFIERFGGKEDIDESFFSSIESIFRVVHEISLHQKTAKAIRSKKRDVEEQLIHLEERNTNTTNNHHSCNQLLDMVRSILNLNGSYCCRCNKSLTKTEVKQCNGCDRMTYCSKKCQREDWLNGHKLSCCMTYTAELSDQFQGRMWPIEAPDSEKDNLIIKYDQAGQFQGTIQPTIPLENIRAATKLKELETNINMIQLKLFLDHSGAILRRAEELDLPLHDCVVRFDLRRCPPEITTKVNESRLSNQAKDGVACVYFAHFYSGLFTEADCEKGGLKTVTMQRILPHKWLTSK